MKEPSLRVKIGGKSVTVPVFKDEKTTLHVVDLVNRRIQEIEASSPRIDTQAFALQTAYSLAVDLARAEAEAIDDEGEFIQALARIQSALDAVLKTLDI